MATSPSPTLHNIIARLAADATLVANLGDFLSIVDPIMTRLNHGARIVVVEESGESGEFTNTARTIASLARVYELTAMWPQFLREGPSPAYVPEAHGRLRDVLRVLRNAGYQVGSWTLSEVSEVEPQSLTSLYSTDAETAPDVPYASCVMNVTVLHHDVGV